MMTNLALRKADRCDAYMEAAALALDQMMKKLDDPARLRDRSRVATVKERCAGALETIDAGRRALRRVRAVLREGRENICVSCPEIDPFSEDPASLILGGILRIADVLRVSLAEIDCVDVRKLQDVGLEPALFEVKRQIAVAVGELDRGLLALTGSYAALARTTGATLGFFADPRQRGLRIVVPGIPLSLNADLSKPSRPHALAWRAVRDWWLFRILGAVDLAGMPKDWERFREVGVGIAFTFGSTPETDLDNYAPKYAPKAINDALVAGGILVDDGVSTLTSLHLWPAWGKEPATEINVIGPGPLYDQMWKIRTSLEELSVAPQPFPTLDPGADLPF